MIFIHLKPSYADIFMAKHEPPGERFIRRFTSFQTKFQIVVDGFPKGLFQFFNTLALEGDDIFKIDYLPVKDTRSSSYSTRPAYFLYLSIVLLPLWIIS
jgi:hypothetical protein